MSNNNNDHSLLSLSNMSATAISFIARTASESESQVAPPLRLTLSALRSQVARHSVKHRYRLSRFSSSMASSVFLCSPSLSPSPSHFF